MPLTCGIRGHRVKATRSTILVVSLKLLPKEVGVFNMKAVYDKRKKNIKKWQSYSWEQTDKKSANHFCKNCGILWQKLNNYMVTFAILVIKHHFIKSFSYCR